MRTPGRKIALSVRERTRRTRNQGRESSSMALRTTREGSGWRKRGHGAAGLEILRGLMSASRPDPPAFAATTRRTSGLKTRHPRPAGPLAAQAARLSGERAATRGRSATEGGDEHAGVKRSYPFELPPRRTGSNGGDLTCWRPLRRRNGAPLIGERHTASERMPTNSLVRTPPPNRIHLTVEVATPRCRPIAVPREWRQGRAARSTPHAQSPPVPLLQAPPARRNKYLRQPNRPDSGSPAPA
jgi:hypothetical protein